MGYNLELRTEKIAGQVNIFDSALVRWITCGVTIDADTVSEDADGKKILPAGTPLGKITATGLYGPYDATATDGRETALVMIAEPVDCTKGDMAVTAFDMARVIIERLPVEVTPELKEQLSGITFVSKE